MEREGKQRTTSRDRGMKMQIQAAAAAAAAAAEIDDGEPDDDVKKNTAAAAVGGGDGGGGGSGGMGSSGSKRISSGVSGAGRSCQAENCMANLTVSKQYHRRHRVCEYHAKAAAVVVAGVRQRFCQQCSRFHELPEFDETKRSCRRRLAGHNERRRKNSGETNSNGSLGGKGPRLVCGEVDDRGKITIAAIPQDNAAANHKQFNIR